MKTEVKHFKIKRGLPALLERKEPEAPRASDECVGVEIAPRVLRCSVYGANAPAPSAVFEVPAVVVISKGQAHVGFEPADEKDPKIAVLQNFEGLLDGSEALDTTNLGTVPDVKTGKPLLKVSDDGRLTSIQQLFALALKPVRARSGVPDVCFVVGDASVKPALSEAAKLAGFARVKFVDRTAAACVALRAEDPRVVLHADLGAARCSFSVVRVYSDGESDVLKTVSGAFGTAGLDAAVIAIAEKKTGTLPPNVRTKLVSRRPELEVKDSLGFDFEGRAVTLTRADFEAAIAPGLELITPALAEAAGVSEVSAFAVSGDSARLIEHLTTLGAEGLVGVSTAQGAALYGRFPPVKLVPVSIGVSLSGGVYQAILPGNARLPTFGALALTTVVDQQASIGFRVVLGECASSSENVLLTEELSLENIEKAKRGVPRLLARFDMEEPTTVKVTVSDVRTDAAVSVTISEIKVTRVDVAHILEAAQVEVPEQLNVTGMPAGGGDIAAGKWLAIAQAFVKPEPAAEPAPVQPEAPPEEAEPEPTPEPEPEADSALVESGSVDASPLAEPGHWEPENQLLGIATTLTSAFNQAPVAAAEPEPEAIAEREPEPAAEPEAEPEPAEPEPAAAEPEPAVEAEPEQPDADEAARQQESAIAWFQHALQICEEASPGLPEEHREALEPTLAWARQALEQAASYDMLGALGMFRDAAQGIVPEAFAW